MVSLWMPLSNVQSSSWSPWCQPCLLLQMNQHGCLCHLSWFELFYVIYLLILSLDNSLRDRRYGCPHFTDESMQAQRGQLLNTVPCPTRPAPYLLSSSSLVTRTRTASTSCPATPPPGLILTEVHSEGGAQVASPSTSAGSGSGTLLGFLGEVGSSAERRGSRETEAQTALQAPAPPAEAGQAAGRANASLGPSLPSCNRAVLCPVTWQSVSLR